MNRLFIIGVATIGLFVTACASAPDTKDVSLSPIVDRSAGIEAQSPLIARDLVNTLSQIQQLLPSNTTLRIMAQALNEDPFARSLKMSLENAGYAIRSAEVNATTATATIDLPVSYTVAKQTDTELQDQSGSTDTLMYTVAVGDVSIRRIYRIFADKSVQPIAAMQVRGADARNIRSDDTIFQLPQTFDDNKPDIMANVQESVQVPAQESAQMSAQNSAQQTGLVSAPQAELETAQEPVHHSAPNSSGKSTVPANSSTVFATREVTDDLAGNASLINIVAPSLASSRPPASKFGSVAELSAAPTRNIRDLGESNFSTVFDKLAIVSETILTFENDSTRLGQHNKSRVQQFVQRFEPATDIFSVIGCSNGATNLAIGQKGLALGRAERVKQELLYAGVPDSNILDEGCWAEEAFDERMPRRGVVLTLKRRG